MKNRHLLLLAFVMLISVKGLTQDLQFAPATPEITNLLRTHLKALTAGDKNAYLGTIQLQPMPKGWIDDSLLWVVNPRMAKPRADKMGNFEIQDLMSQYAKVTNYGKPAMLVLFKVNQLPGTRYPYDALKHQGIIAILIGLKMDPKQAMGFVIDPQTRKIVMPDPALKARD